MKRLLVLVFFCPLLAMAQKKFSLSGKIEGLRENSLIALTDINTPTDTIAKTRVKKDGFILAGSLKEPMLLTLGMEDNKRFAVFLDNSVIKISGNVNDLKSVKVTGSATHAAFTIFQNKFNPLFERLGKINHQM